MLEPALALVLVAAAFLPPILFLVYVRNQELTRREPWSAIVKAFVFGAVVSVAIALVLESAFHGGGLREYQILEGQFTVPSLVFLVVIVAPIVEEFAKALGVRSVRKEIEEEEDGIIYGAAVGFGFSATENLLYEFSALNEEGTSALLVTALVRTFTGCFLHATAAGLVGYGLGRMYRSNGRFGEVLPYYAMAVLLHALFNLVAVLQFAAAVGIIVIFSFLGIRYTVNKIRRLDAVPAFTSDQGPP